MSDGGIVIHHRPADGTEARRWWDKGAADEAAARNEGLSPEAREVRDTLEALARSRRRDSDAAELTGSLARIYHAGEPFTRRLALAWDLIRA